MQKPEHLKIGNIDRDWADLSRWLVKRFGSKDVKNFYRSATQKTWTGIIDSRTPFVEAVKDYYDSLLAQRYAITTISHEVSTINAFMHWVDDVGYNLTLDGTSVESAFRGYDEYLYRKACLAKDIKHASAAAYLQVIARCLSAISDRPAHDPLRHHSRVICTYKGARRVSVSRSAEKQHLGDTRELGYFCVDLANALTIDAIYGQHPLIVTTVKPDSTEVPVTILPKRIRLALDGNSSNMSLQSAQEWCKPTDKLDPHRYQLARQRMVAEFVIFVYHTGINVTPALHIERKGFKYHSAGNSEWRVTCKKGRKHGAVSFMVYSDYRPRLKRYIEFVDHFCPDSPYLFPISTEARLPYGQAHYLPFKTLLASVGIPWIPPRVNRNTRVNFLDRIVGDPDVSAEMAQHARETFKQKYERPSQQRAMSALTCFWNKNPVSLLDGGCSGEPEATTDKPSDVVNPDCTHSAGCLWCTKHRDIESEDYVWSLTTFRHLKLIEAAQPVKRDIPADIAITRLSEKLKAFKELNEQSRHWVEEAFMRVAEGDYHPTWKNVISFWEAK